MFKGTKNISIQYFIIGCSYIFQQYYPMGSRAISLLSKHSTALDRRYLIMS